jgi:hypothetical protein
MTITFNCPQCGRQLRVEDEVAGKTSKCNDCGEAVRVPGSPKAVLAPGQRPAAETEEESLLEPPLPIARAAPNTHTVPARASAGPVQVTVQQPSRAARSLGITAMLLGVIAISSGWIPLVGAIGIPLGAFGLLLAMIGTIMATVRRGTGLGFSIGGGLICALAIFVAASITFSAAKATVAPVISVADAANKAAKAEQVGWDTAGLSAKDDTALVTITDVKIGKVKLETFDGSAREFKDSKLLVSVSVTNTNAARKLELLGWGSHDATSKEDSVKLLDERDNSYRKFTTSGVRTIVGQADAPSVGPGETVTDLLVFEPPIAQAKVLRLRLARSNYRSDGYLQFKFPAPR